MLTSWAILALGLGAGSASSERLLAEAKLSLQEVLTRVAWPDGSVVAAELKGGEGRTVYRVVLAREKHSEVVEIDVKTGEVIRETRSSKDYSRVLGVSRRTLAEAVEVALRRVEGRAIEAELTLEGGRAVIEVEVFGRGRVFEVSLDAVTGEVIEVDEDDDR